ncbi:phytanoyl-CoA dioxygenase family protein [Streptomyces sp. NPDC057540]|uniref:phytanoyl-CoA dioxygenase family protein n=1 Tax=Streptomyces sp. NPDC057540 TaxID=3346160 RepID=UPI00367863B5
MPYTWWAGTLLTPRGRFITPLARRMLSLLYRDAVWLWCLNGRARLRHLAGRDRAPRPPAGPAGSSLTREGYVRVEFAESLWRAVAGAAETLMAAPRNARQIADGRSAAGGKDYQIRLLADEGQQLDLSHPVARTVLDSSVLAQVADHLGCWPRLHSVDIWLNLPVAVDRPPEASQRWHRDYEDHRIVKLFVYLRDVNEATGPLTVVGATHSRGRHWRVLPAPVPHGMVLDERAVAAAFTPRDIHPLCGPAGSAYLVDTTAVHRGGRSTHLPRLVLTATYATGAAVRPIQLRPSLTGSLAGLTPLQRHAVAPRHVQPAAVAGRGGTWVAPPWTATIEAAKVNRSQNLATFPSQDQ